MNLTKSLIIATAETYTREQLLQMRATALAKLSEMDYISTATTGAGAQYTLQQRATAEDLIQLYSLALDYQASGEIGSTAEVFSINYHL